MKVVFQAISAVSLAVAAAAISAIALLQWSDSTMIIPAKGTVVCVTKGGATHRGVVREVSGFTVIFENDVYVDWREVESWKWH